ncbi:MAG: DUF167 domain-containing protein [Promethearchaeota archaeon]
MIELHNKGTLLRIYVKPRSKKEGITLTENQLCEVHVKAPPTRGQANLAVVKFIAKKLGIQANRVRIISGEKASHKVLLIENMTPESVMTAFKT